MSKTENIVGAAVEKKAKKKAKKRFKKFTHSVMWTLFLLSVGIWIGIHRNVIKAYVNGEELPEAPSGHWYHDWLHKLG